MIYSKFGTVLALVSKTESVGGRVRVQATVDGTPEVHEYELADLKADDGLTEINAAVAALPAKVFENRSTATASPLERHGVDGRRSARRGHHDRAGTCG